MANPGVYSLPLYQGDRFELFFRVRNKVWNPITGVFDYSYVNLTGRTFKAQLRTKKDDATVAAEFTCTLGDQAASPGAVLCVLLPAQTAALTAESYVYDVQMSEDAEHVTTVLQGTATLTKDVTRV